MASVTNESRNSVGVTTTRGVERGEGRERGGVSGSITTTPINQNGLYVGSINGKIYHLPWCSGAIRIREENKVWFVSKEEATQKGYSPAANCKGI